jgi:predicted AAA+ superfamily ATPase
MRYCLDPELSGRRMIWIAGPRQTGKTFLAKEHLSRNHCERLYYNWDDPVTRRQYLKDPTWFESAARQATAVERPWIVFDEIHKRPRWRDILKGAYDRFHDDFRFMVTGSARLELFRKGGDSLAGRYSLFHLSPLNLREVSGRVHGPLLADPSISAKAMHDLLEGEPVHPGDFAALRDFPPFPEPFLLQSRRGSEKWRRDYLELITREDLRDLTRVREIERVQQLVWLLPERVGSLLSMPDVGRLIEAAHTTVKSWLEELRKLYVAFPLLPWSRRIGRALRRERKWYLTDHSIVQDAGRRFENLVACHLYRAAAAWSDMGLGDHQVFYLRTLDKTEIDFVMICNNKPWLCVECKLSDTKPASSLVRRKDILGIPTLGIQVVETTGIFSRPEAGLWVVSADRFLLLLP